MRYKCHYADGNSEDDKPLNFKDQNKRIIGGDVTPEGHKGDSILNHSPELLKSGDSEMNGSYSLDDGDDAVHITINVRRFEMMIT
ncbi:hypothetical protein Tco_0868769 [Tanacetum coccineum]